GMSAADFSPALDILRSLYRSARTLEEFANGVAFRDGRSPVLVEQRDSSRFQTFARGIYVCFDKELQQVPSRDQVTICTLPELLAFVLNSLKRKRKRNILANGYSFLSLAQEERDADPFKLQGDVTQSAAYIHGSDMWKKVATRLGTDLMRYLLDSCCLFVAVPPSCVFQVCGPPVYDKVSMSTASAGFFLQPRSRTRKGAPFGRNPGAVSSKRKPAVGTPTISSVGDRRDVGTTKGKRKRDTDKKDEEGIMTSSKRRRLEGGPGWRSGTFPPLPPSHCFIRTLGFLYGGRGMRGFLLNKKKKTPGGGRRLQGQDLVRVVFFEGLAYLSGAERKPKKLPRRFLNVVPVFGRLLRLHRRCPYSRTLQKMCPVAEASDASQGELSSLLPQHCAPHRVYLFVRECLSAVVPRELWGSDHNRLQFFFRVRSFLSSGKFERLSLAELMWKMKVNDCDWLKISKTGRFPPSELSYRTQILGQFLAWLLDGYVVALVRACFYVTESMSQKNAVRFYRQEVWAKLQDLAFRGHISKGQMEELTPAQVAALPKATVVSRLRFIPKTDSMRPITRVLGADAKTRVRHALYRGRVRDLLDILRACVRATPSLLGSTVWGMTDIHKVLSPLAAPQKQEHQPLYFVKVDVSGAYESLPHDKLIEVVEQALKPVQNEFFIVRCYAKIWADSHEGLKKSFVRQVRLSLTHTHTHTHTHSLSNSLSNSLTHSHGKKQTYRQSRGIPQGSVVSSLLCCLCYGHMENVLFKDIVEKRGCLMRLMDDFLLITPNLHNAQTFLSVLLAGVPEYGLVVNPQKVAVNFPVTGDAVSCPGIRVLPPHCLFPWCGLLLDTRSLDVSKDYSSYAGLSLRYSLTLGSCHSAGQQMRRKLMAVLRLKCHALFLDLKTNSLEAVYKNIYKLVLLHACRFHVCAQSLPYGQTVAKNPVYFLQMILDMAEYGNQLIRLSNKGMILGSKTQRGVVQYEAVELLFCFSFLLVLSPHRPLYEALLPHLHRRTAARKFYTVTPLSAAVWDML
uniref:Telomerase reverse transcriptase n=1 Tax=Gasterosteus aculeatus aculeatus TaxID=481459 RepID=A0AAQ4R8P8_GASAC